VIVAVELTSSAPITLRAAVLVPLAAVYGLVLAWAGVRIAGAAAEPKLPELCQVALRSEL
jgi:hypothetical protein